MHIIFSKLHICNFINQSVLTSLVCGGARGGGGGAAVDRANCGFDCVVY